MNKILIVILLGIVYSCSYYFQRTEKLGSNFFLSEFDSKNIEILYSEGSDLYEKAAIVIPSLITSYNYDENWIIATSVNEKRDSTFYWIIDKKISYNRQQIGEQLKQHMVGPLDSIQFYRELNKRSIYMRLKDVLH